MAEKPVRSRRAALAGFASSLVLFCVSALLGFVVITRTIHAQIPNPDAPGAGDSIAFGYLIEVPEVLVVSLVVSVLVGYLAYRKFPLPGPSDK